MRRRGMCPSRVYLAAVIYGGRPVTEYRADLTDKQWAELLRAWPTQARTGVVTCGA